MMTNVIKYPCKFFNMLNHVNSNVLIDRDNDRDIIYYLTNSIITFSYLIFEY